MSPRGTTIDNHTQSFHQEIRALRLILADVGLAVGLASPWGGFTYHEVTLRKLTDARETSIQENTGNALKNFKISPNL